MRRSDPLDAAVDYAERQLQEAMQYRAPAGPEATGRCLDPYCDEELHEVGRRFCNAECRDSYEKWRRMNPGTPLRGRT